MTDRWTAIRRCARAVLDCYEQQAQEKGAPAAWTDERGSYAVLGDIARLALGAPYCVQADELPDNVFARISLAGRTIEVCATLDACQQALATAHAIGHIALDHPPACLADADGAPSIIEDGPSHINEQPQASALLHHNGTASPYRDRDRLELEANVFALELLAPLQRVRAAVESDRNWTVEALALYFGVSQEAMRNQLVAALMACPRPDPLDAALAAEPDGDAATAFLTLDPQQRAAAEIATPALVVAGPGAGKTRVLTARFVHLVQRGVAPEKILALTFSNKAAAEMQARLTAALPEHAAEVQVFTFHSLGLQLLTTYGAHLGFEEPPQVLSDSDAFVLLRTALHQLPLGQFHNLSDPTQFLDPILTRIGRLKDDLIDPDDFRERVEAWGTALESQRPDDPVAEVLRQEELTTAGKVRDLAAVYATYQEWLRREGYVDYGDLIHQTIQLFDHPSAAAAIRDSYQHILVDEFQDINYGCGQLVKALDGGRRVVWAVADPRQSIYGFRGAALSNLTRFEVDYPEPHVVTLDVNYRSVEEVVQAGQAIGFPDAPGGRAFAVPTLRAERGPLAEDGASPPALQASEAMAYEQEIAELVARVGEVSKTVPREQIAVLCRDKYLARDICNALEGTGIATNWGSGLEDRDAFKDLMAVLLLATNQPQGLLRLARMRPHRIEESDVRLLLAVAARHEHNLRAALKAAHQGEVDGLTDAGRQAASHLCRLAFKLRHLPSAWHVLVAYLFEETTWARGLFSDGRASALRYLVSANQLLDLARDFAQQTRAARHGPAGREGTAGFIDYMTSARETGKLPGPDSSAVIADAVNVLTIHKSKGLEWPVVFVPDWTYPAQTAPEPVPLPQHLLHDSGTDSAAYSRACLYYVAVTRARDRLFISRSQRYNRDPLPFWDDLFKHLEPRGLLACHAVQREAWARPGKECRAPRVGVAEPIPYAMIRQYQYCSQRAKYDYVYGLQAGGGDYLFFVRRLRVALRWIAEAASAGAVPGAAAIDAFLEVMQAESAPSQRRLLPLYGGQLQACAHTFAARLQPGSQVHLDQPWHFEQPGKPVISFRIDEIEYGTRPVVRFHRYGKPSSHHETDPILCFYANLTVGDTTPEVRLHYLETGEERPLELFAGHPAFDKKLKDIYTAAYAIKNGVFEPKPKKRNACDRCPYHAICPA